MHQSAIPESQQPVQELPVVNMLEQLEEALANGAGPLTKLATAPQGSFVSTESLPTATLHATADVPTAAESTAAHATAADTSDAEATAASVSAADPTPAPSRPSLASARAWAPPGSPAARTGADAESQTSAAVHVFDVVAAARFSQATLKGISDAKARKKRSGARSVAEATIIAAQHAATAAAAATAASSTPASCPSALSSKAGPRGGALSGSPEGQTRAPPSAASSTAEEEPMSTVAAPGKARATPGSPAADHAAASGTQAAQPKPATAPEESDGEGQWEVVPGAQHLKQLKDVKARWLANGATCTVKR